MNDSRARASAGLDCEGREIYCDLWSELGRRRDMSRIEAKLLGLRAMYGDEKVLTDYPNILRDIVLALVTVTNASQGFHDLRSDIDCGIDPRSRL